MSRKTVSILAAVLCLLLALTACGGSAMSQEDYQTRVEALNADIMDAMTGLGGLTVTDEDALRDGISAVRDMAQPFRDFAAIDNPPKDWADAHAKVAEGCTGFADALEGMCDSAEQMLDGEITTEAYNTAITDYTTDLTAAATQLTEGFTAMT